jgi:hypothetical protein
LSSGLPGASMADLRASGFRCMFRSQGAQGRGRHSSAAERWR